MSIAIELADAQRAWRCATEDETARQEASARIHDLMAQAGHRRAVVVDSIGPTGIRYVAVIWGVDGTAFT